MGETEAIQRLEEDAGTAITFCSSVSRTEKPSTTGALTLLAPVDHLLPGGIIKSFHIFEAQVFCSVLEIDRVFVCPVATIHVQGGVEVLFKKLWIEKSRLAKRSAGQRRSFARDRVATDTFRMSITPGARRFKIQSVMFWRCNDHHQYKRVGGGELRVRVVATTETKLKSRRKILHVSAIGFMLEWKGWFSIYKHSSRWLMNKKSSSKCPNCKMRYFNQQRIWEIFNENYLYLIKIGVFIIPSKERSTSSQSSCWLNLRLKHDLTSNLSTVNLVMMCKFEPLTEIL